MCQSDESRVYVLLFSAAAQERAHAYRDDEVKDANHAINMQHAQMHRGTAYHELRMHEPNMRIQTEVSRRHLKQNGRQKIFLFLPTGLELIKNM